MHQDTQEEVENMQKAQLTLSNTVDRSDISQVIDLGASTMIQVATLQGWVLAQELCATFVENRKEILGKIGDFYFPNITAIETKKERIKILMLTLDFDGSLEKLGNDWKILDPQKLKNKTCNIKLNNSPHIFHFREHVNNLPARTDWISDTVPEMVNLITQIKNGPRNRPKVTTPFLSYKN